MASKHTPGPWHVFHNRGTDCPGIEADGMSIVVWGERDTEGCGVRGGSVAEELANAHLIAAAPDMLEALRVALLHVTHEETTTASEPTKDAMRGIAKRLRVAIAKAEGRA